MSPSNVGSSIVAAAIGLVVITFLVQTQMSQIENEKEIKRAKVSIANSQKEIEDSLKITKEIDDRRTRKESLNEKLLFIYIDNRRPGPEECKELRNLADDTDKYKIKGLCND